MFHFSTFTVGEIVIQAAHMHKGGWGAVFTALGGLYISWITVQRHINLYETATPFLTQGGGEWIGREGKGVKPAPTAKPAKRGINLYQV